MRSSILSTLFVCLLQTNLILAVGGEIKGNGNIIKENRNVSGYTEISAGGVFDVVLTQGETNSLQLEGEENILPHVQVVVKGDKLWISMDPVHNYKINKNIKVSITLPKLSGIDASGASKFTGTNVFNKSNDFEIDGSGVAKISLNLIAGNLEIDLSGASNLMLSGNATNAEIHLSGAADLEGKSLVTVGTEVKTSGASSVEITAFQTLDVQASGSSTVNFYGEAELTSTSSGSAKIKKLK